MADLSKYLGEIYLSAIPSPEDKLAECQFFFDLLSKEHYKNRFRCLLSAFLGASYSFLEIKASFLYFAFNNPETGEPIEDSESLEILRKYVDTFQNKKIQIS
jgi:hypothetical protein